MKRIYFGTDGVRGKYGTPQMNEDLAYRLGAASGQWLVEAGGPKGSAVFIGRDTRFSGPLLERALASGLENSGFKPVSIGVVPTAAVSIVTKERGGVLGVVITASHNPAEDNGIKFFGANGLKLSDAQEFEIEQQLLRVTPIASRSDSTIETRLSEVDLYLDRVRDILPPASLTEWKIVLDTANGAGCFTSRSVLAGLGADLSIIGGEPNGQNINADVGSQHPEKMSAAVRKSGAKLGIAHDGDADRCILCDETGDVLDGDEILTILAVDAIERGRLTNNVLVITQQSNLGVDAALASLGAAVARTAIGDRYVIEKMIETGAALGGESSGHIICPDIAQTGDGLTAALKVLAVMISTGKPLSALRKVLKKFPLATADLKVKEKLPLAGLRHFQTVLQKVTADLGAKGRVMVRYSGTEAKLRLLVEGESTDVVNSAVEQLKIAAGRDLEVL